MLCRIRFQVQLRCHFAHDFSKLKRIAKVGLSMPLNSGDLLTASRHFFCAGLTRRWSYEALQLRLDQ